MVPAALSFIAKLESMKLRFDVNEANAGRAENVRITFNCRTNNSITLTFFFDQNNKTVNIKVFTISKVLPEKLMDVYIFLNELNAKYRWVKFFLDEDNEVTVSGDAVLDPGSAGEELFELMNRYIGIIDEVYPKLMKIIWG